ncbi:MAG: hypothetical protein JWO03_2961 [Bacteroidetes bacterium]|nr:hypothetical protein [Bacteroidota bacterium]
MAPLATYHRKRPQQSCAGKVIEVCLIETEGTADLPYFLQWIRLAQVRKGILILANVPGYEPHSLEILQEIKTRGIDVIHVDFPAGQGNLVGAISAKNAFPLPATDLITTFAHTATGRKIFHIGHHSRHDYAGLRHDARFRSVVTRLGFDTIACSDRDRPALEGGDYLLVGDHLFIGRRTDEAFAPNAAQRIREYYDLCDILHIHTVGVTDPSPTAGLYHLDLYFTYAGMDTSGVHRFMVGYIDDTSIGDPLIPAMSAELDTFREHIAATLYECFGDKYILIPVPIIVCDIYRISPLNGIVDYINGTTKYYFPWPKFINAAAHPEYNTHHRITTSVQKAFDIISSVLGTGNVIRFDFPISYAAGSGQSLHCTMAVIGRASP